MVVTGAASGIGKATALLLRERGSEVIAVDVNAPGLADAAAAGAEIVACDITRADERARLLNAAGDVDGLVNAAGIIRLIPITEVTEEDWDSILAVNVKALFFLARDFGLRMPAGAGIVNPLRSPRRTTRRPKPSPTARRKQECSQSPAGSPTTSAPAGVRVNAILPGITDTPMQDKVLVEIAAIRGTTPKRCTSPDSDAVPLQRRVRAT